VISVPPEHLDKQRLEKYFLCANLSKFILLVGEDKGTERKSINSRKINLSGSFVGVIFALFCQFVYLVRACNILQHKSQWYYYHLRLKYLITCIQSIQAGIVHILYFSILLK
jgi:hypothetical protein